MSKKFLDEKGITLTILVLTVIVMLILVTTVGISVSGYADVKTLKIFYNDIQLVREKTDIYYEKNNTLDEKTKLEWLNKFFKRLNTALYKWYIAPIGPVIDGRSISKIEFRQPITSDMNYSK